MTRLRAKTDANHAAIRDALRANGWHVEDTARLGGGFPDLVAIRHGIVEFIEIKDGRKPPSKRQLTPLEQVTVLKFHAAGKRILVLESVDQAKEL